MAEAKSVLKEPYVNVEQQRETARLGLWLFLSTEVLFFGGVFMAFAVYRMVYPGGFAIAGKETNLLFGSINTAILLTSGLTVAIAVHAIETNRIGKCRNYLLVTILLGLAFLGIKGVEYAEEIHRGLVPGPSFSLGGKPASEIFFWLYWIMTGIHAFHLIVGIGVLSVIAFLVSRNRYSEIDHTPVELSALYWGFVDIVWLYLYPLLYLIDRAR